MPVGFGVGGLVGFGVGVGTAAVLGVLHTATATDDFWVSSF